MGRMVIKEFSVDVSTIPIDHPIHGYTLRIVLKDVDGTTVDVWEQNQLKETTIKQGLIKLLRLAWRNS